MTMHLETGGAAVNLPSNDEAPAVAAARGFENQKQTEKSDSLADGAAHQASPTTAGDDCTPANLNRLHEDLPGRHDPAFPSLAPLAERRMGGSHG